MFWNKKPTTEKFTLDERKQIRQEAVKGSVVETFGSYKITSNMYSFKVVPMDERWHSFAVLVEATSHFAFSGHSNTKSIMQIEEDLSITLLDLYRIKLVGIYWHVTESSENFNKAALKPFESKVPNKNPFRSINQIAATLHESVVFEEEPVATQAFPPDYNTIPMDLDSLNKLK